MKMRLFIAFLCFNSLLFSQEIDSLAKDSIPQHSIKKAVILSAIIPAAGQVYNSIYMEKGVKGKNKIYWKIPLIYSALGATGYLLIKNQLTKQSIKQEYKDRYITPKSELNLKWDGLDSISIVTNYNQYSTRRDLTLLAFGAAYLIQIIDAGIEAHFVKFDLSEDLTFQVKPKIYNFNTIGIGMSFNFHEKIDYQTNKSNFVFNSN